MLKTINFFIKPYKFLFASVVLVTVVTSVLESLNIAILLPLLKGILGPSDTDVFEGLPAIFSNLRILFPFSDTVRSIFVLFMAIIVIKSIVGIFREWLKAYISGTVLYDLKKKLLERYSEISYQSILEQKQGVLVYNCTVSSKMAAGFILRLSDGISEGFKIIAIVLVLAGMQSLVTSLAIVIGIIFYGLNHYLSKKVSYNIGKGRFISGTGQNVIINEFFNGIKHIIMYNARDRWLKAFDRQSRIFTKLFIKDTLWLYIPKYIIELTAIALIFGAVIYLKVIQSSQFSLYLPLIGVFAFALVRLLPSITYMGQIRMGLLSNLPELEAIKKTLTTDLPIRRKGGKEISAFKDHIEFSDVSFSYNDGTNILSNVSFLIEKGKVTAIVGASGTGKSTIVNLILGLLEPSKGKIRVDGEDLREIDPERWSRLIGLVSQDMFIYHATVKDNITFGDDSFTEEEIINAAKVAYADEFITAMPDGYETVVGERGMKLSGGQQQRLGIARAVIREPEILIFDEATSSLDSISEQAVQKAIYNLTKDHTIIIIAHRLSTIRNADKIVVLDKGRVAEIGNHGELLEANGVYSRLTKGGIEIGS
jgi:ABC-type multidrug transport system fused ATPase/permease subunit